MRVLVTGGAGFLGSHLCDALLERGDAVVCIDNLSSGRIANIRHLMSVSRFTFIEADIIEGVDLLSRVDAVAHLASMASPKDYLRHPLETLQVNSRGAEHALRLAQRDGARFALASTSEVYGDPVVHPQTEDYWGNVNPIGPRSVYDEAKRYAEALTFAYRRIHGTNTGVVRIFNTYGPRMRSSDGRLVSNFITQALDGTALTVYGDGKQTRSLCYVDDIVSGLIAMLDSAEPGPVNLGNPEELSVLEFAKLVLRVTGSNSTLSNLPLPQDDPTRRCPDIERAQSLLGWKPRVGTEEGVRRTVAWFNSQRSRKAARPGAGERRPSNRRSGGRPPLESPDAESAESPDLHVTDDLTVDGQLAVRLCGEVVVNGAADEARMHGTDTPAITPDVLCLARGEQISPDAPASGLLPMFTMGDEDRGTPRCLLTLTSGMSAPDTVASYPSSPVMLKRQLLVGAVRNCVRGSVATFNAGWLALATLVESVVMVPWAAVVIEKVPRPIGAELFELAVRAGKGARRLEPPRRYLPESMPFPICRLDMSATLYYMNADQAARVLMETSAEICGALADLGKVVTLLGLRLDPVGYPAVSL